ncbi:putative RNA-directed DNA polymerase transcription factor C3H family [Helianthus annuus]|nr:putative RNA-directed DNA polymerase transcription factor C3H family [Helianthus annuus]
MPPRKEPCRNFWRESCQYGERYKFLHVNQQQAKPNQNLFEFGSQNSTQPHASNRDLESDIGELDDNEEDARARINVDIRTGTIIGRGTERQGLYYVDEVAQQGTVMLAHGTIKREAWLWHRRLGHPSAGYLRLLFPKLFPSGDKINCETCLLAKSHRQPFKTNNTRVNVPFALIHSDVRGPSPITGGQGFRYFLLFIDDCTRMTWVYFLKHKSEVFEKFTIFHTMIHTQFQKEIQILRSDNGGGDSLMHP